MRCHIQLPVIFHRCKFYKSLFPHRQLYYLLVLLLRDRIKKKNKHRFTIFGLLASLATTKCIVEYDTISIRATATTYLASCATSRKWKKGHRFVCVEFLLLFFHFYNLIPSGAVYTSFIRASNFIFIYTTIIFQCTRAHIYFRVKSLPYRRPCSKEPIHRF